MAPIPPGAREIDPEAEAARLAKERSDPLFREWGVRHPDGFVSVGITGMVFGSRHAADEARADCERECDWCESHPHTLVWRDRPPWQQEPGE